MSKDKGLLTFRRVLCVLNLCGVQFAGLLHTRHNDQPLDERAIRLEAFIVAAATRHRIDARILRAICFVESRYQINVVSPKGARGPMHLCGRRLLAMVFVIHTIRSRRSMPRRLFERCLRKFGGRVDLDVAAYNAGEGALL